MYTDPYRRAARSVSRHAVSCAPQGLHKRARFLQATAPAAGGTKSDFSETFRAGGVPRDLPGEPGHPLEATDSIFHRFLDVPGRAFESIWETRGPPSAPFGITFAYRGRPKERKRPSEALARPHASLKCEKNRPGTCKCDENCSRKGPLSRIFAQKGALGLLKVSFGTPL